ncbi:helix-turn-helix domain-containing protein [Haloarchaeobius baliensis]|uniref:helix-turn-helix domain-containing protein n=1 Tax=Haloarchaeobius baliensis TaxID=1670458 RepID=UPI003F883437
MATIAEFVIPATEFPLGRIAEELPDVTVELERIIPTRDAIVPYLWVRGCDGPLESDTLARLTAQTDLKDVEVVDRVEGAYLLRAEWRSRYEGVLRAITDTDVVLLSGVGNAEQWTFELRGTDHESIAAFQQCCRELDIHATLVSLQRLSELQTGQDHDLTPAQQEALVLAYEQGYYESPRQVTLAELAETLGITGQSLGSRLRRGTHRLIENTLIE